MEKLTEKQAFAAMVLFLESFYERTQSDEIGGLLSDLLMSEDGTTADPAAWDDWMECVRKILVVQQNKLSSSLLDNLPS
ncbi:MAG TPA: hypothetical protein DDW76_25155 [Cyanobacteria bacterium UBA11369]|nr:hypothetical protein [Cyanobacteria bacterium UBA11371]HBE31186.1 hypothetical protein [Cyanobacteria bacterium UBA11368]HBE51975.1 hypothetical protein [Cyanobacteria bacterium UBA11369]